MKELYKKYINWIIVFLICLCCFKSCQSCSRGRSLDYQKYSYEYVIDSLNKDIIHYQDTIKSQQDTIKIYQIQLNIMDENNKMLKESNKYFQNTNRTLINTNKELSINKIE